MADVRMNGTVAVVVTWNRKELLRECLGCLLGQEGAGCDILLVDNDSTDGTGEMIAEDFNLPQLHYLNTGANLGGAGGFMVGIETAAKMGYERIWVMDDDCLPSETALSVLLEADESLGGEWGFLCSAVYWTDGTLCNVNRPKLDLFKKIKSFDGDEPVPVRMASFVSIMFRADVVREVGLPIADYFIWTDDYEYTGRISKRYRGYAVPRSSVTHATRENSRHSLADEDLSRTDRYYYLCRNDVHCYREHGLAGRAYLAAKFAYTAAGIIKNGTGGGGVLRGYPSSCAAPATACASSRWFSTSTCLRRWVA